MTTDVHILSVPSQKDAQTVTFRLLAAIAQHSVQEQLHRHSEKKDNYFSVSLKIFSGKQTQINCCC